MVEKRATTTRDVEGLRASRNLPWESVQDLVVPFPRRGVLDEYVEGQADEVDAPGGPAWSDREEPSTEEEENECPERGRRAGSCTGRDVLALSGA